jgi:uncharacterized protein YcfJ
MQNGFMATGGKNKFVALIMTITMCFFFLTACGQKLGKQITKVEHYPKCYEPIGILRANAEQLKNNVIGAAIGGAIIGGITGYLATGKAEGALAGVVVGAVAGATLGYLITSEVQSKSTAERFRVYNQTIDAEIAKLDQAVQAARMTLSCYGQSYNELNVQYNKNAVSKEEMLARLTEIRDGASEANTILLNYKDATAKNVQQFDEIVKAETQREQDRASQAEIKQLENANKKKLAAQESNVSKISDSLGVLTANANTQLEVLQAQEGSPAWAEADVIESLPVWVCTNF